MSGAVQLTDWPLEEGSPILALDSDPKPRRYRATFKGKDYSVIVSRDNISGTFGSPDRRWHVSVAGEKRVPPWEAFVQIVHAVRPGVTFCVPMPPATQWMNLNERVLHVWELHDEPLAKQWAMEGRGDRVT